MVAAAVHWGSTEIIFPEIAALAFGAWVTEERPWPGPAWTLWFSPTLGAVTGIAIMRFVPTSLSVAVALAFALVLLELDVNRSAISPAVSAAVLPIVTGIRGWIYPASVCLMAALVAGVAKIRERRRFPPQTTTSPSCRPLPPRSRLVLAHQGKLALCVLGIAVVALRTPWTFIVAPPLLVAFVELAHPDCRWRDSLGRLIVLLTGSAAVGSIVMEVISALAGPLWLAALLAVAICFALVRGLRVNAPPAFALALLPTILPPAMLTTYPLQVLLGSLIIVLVIRLWFPAVERG